MNFIEIVYLLLKYILEPKLFHLYCLSTCHDQLSAIQTYSECGWLIIPAIIPLKAKVINRDQLGSWLTFFVPSIDQQNTLLIISLDRGVQQNVIEN